MIDEEQIPTYNPFDKVSDRKVKIDFNAIRQASEIDLNKLIAHPPTAISMGEYMYRGQHYPIPFGSYGDISCIVGASKSKKTFFKSAIEAAYIGGNSTNYFSNMYGIDSKDKFVISIDTEQSKYHTQRAAKRVEYMTGISHPK